MALEKEMAAAICVLALSSASGSACSMTHSAARPEKCSVIGGENLPAEIGGPMQLCSTIEAAAASQAPGAEFTIDVHVLSDHSLAVSVRLADGRLLPEQKMAVSDRELSRAAIERFGASIGRAIGEFSGQ